MNGNSHTSTASTRSRRDLDFDDTAVLQYLRLGNDHRPSPLTDPITFLKQNQYLKRLPPRLLRSFAVITTPKQRTLIPAIRNRRLKYVNSQPPELEFESARATWPDLWQSQDRYRAAAQREKQDERAWAESQFLGGQKQEVGKLGALLGDYAEERAVERMRASSRRQIHEEFVAEEEENEDSGDDNPPLNSNVLDEEMRASFERKLHEHFIYGLLGDINYDSVDWNDEWDSDNDRFDEERWFDEEEESA